jgi:hypothetical protein
MRRHELDPVSLTFGFAFTGLGLLFLVGRADQAFRLRWIWPILLLVLGVGILADLARHRGSEADSPVPTPPPDRALTPTPDPTSPKDLAPDRDQTLEAEEDQALDRQGDQALVEQEGAVDSREHPI